MKKKSIYAALVGAAIAGVSLNASAGVVDPGNLGVLVPVTPDTYFTTGPLVEGQVTASSGTSYMSNITATGQELGGIGLITSIQPGVNSPVWTSGQNGVQLGMQFGGYIAQSIQTNSNGTITVMFSGGWANYYTAPVGTFNANASINPTAAFATAGGTPWLNTVATPESQCVLNNHCLDVVGTNITLISTVNGTLANLQNGSGGFGYMSVGPGTGVANSNFATGTYTTPIGFSADMFLNSSFQNPVPGNTQFAANGSFNLSGVAVPEPGTLLLMGIGAIGIGFVASRKSKQINFA